MAMKKPDNIYVNLQLRKDQTSGGLLLDIHFNKDAPNFSIDHDNINWCPTIEELDFIAEVFDLIAKGKRGTEGKPRSTDEAPATRQVDETSLLDRVMDKKDRRSYTMTSDR
jgi:hypothetical protein